MGGIDASRNAGPCTFHVPSLGSEAPFFCVGCCLVVLRDMANLSALGWVSTLFAINLVQRTANPSINFVAWERSRANRRRPAIPNR